MFLSAAYYTALLILVLLCIYRATLLSASRRTVHTGVAPEFDILLPHVCVQLPVYNEPLVIERLLRAVYALDYPSRLLEIQILDDSTDDTTSLIDGFVSRVPSNALVRVLRRSSRRNFKAGALKAGLEQTDAPVVAIFDADFVPPPDFLLKTVPRLAPPDIAFVQARWGHLNATENFLTRAQTVLLDAHFMIEHGGRHNLGVCFNFNGTAGIWRREAILDAGNWQGDTLTEDLDLSYRAQLRGWKAVFLPEIVCPAELPSSVSQLRSQQYRWAKGSAQTLRKLFFPIVRSKLSPLRKLHALLHLCSNIGFLAGMVFVAFLLPLLIVRKSMLTPTIVPIEAVVFLCTLGSSALFYANGARLASGRWKWVDVLAALTVGAGISLHCSRAVISGWFGGTGVFVRTPKTGSTNEHSLSAPATFRFDRPCLVRSKEALMLLYLLVCLVTALVTLPITTLMICAPCFGLVLGGYAIMVFWREQPEVRTS